MGGGRREVVEKEKAGRADGEANGLGGERVGRGGEVEERTRGGVLVEEKRRGREEPEVERGGGEEEVEVVRAVRGEGSLGRGEVNMGSLGMCEGKGEDSEERVALPLEPTVRIQTR